MNLRKSSKVGSVSWQHRTTCQGQGVGRMSDLPLSPPVPHNYLNSLRLLTAEKVVLQNLTCPAITQVLTCLTPHKGFHFRRPETQKVGTDFCKLLSFIASVSLYTFLKALWQKLCLVGLSACSFYTVHVSKVKPVKRTYL